MSGEARHEPAPLSRKRPMHRVRPEPKTWRPNKRHRASEQAFSPATDLYACRPRIVNGNSRRSDGPDSAPFSPQNPFSESFKPLRKNIFSFELSVLVIDFSRPNNSAQIGWASLAVFGHRQSASFLSCVHVRIGDLPGLSRRSLSVSFRYRSFAPRFPSAFSRSNSPWHSASLTCRIRCYQRHRSASRDDWRHSNRGQVRRCAAAWRGGRDSPAIGPHHRPAR